MRTAFKEWAVIVEALGRGMQVLILRKGGIAEGRNGFQLDHSRCLLFPTHVHQHRSQVTSSGEAVYDEVSSRSVADGRVEIRYRAEVTGWRKINSCDEALRLSPLHIWRPGVVAGRFVWGREQAIVAIALRVFRLRCPADLPLLPAYGGCRSWIELAEDVGENAEPVLNDSDYAAHISALEAALGGSLTSSC